LFKDIYELRNVLAHEVWASSDDYPGAVLFSRLQEEARLLIASERIVHDVETTAERTFNSIVRYIRNIKIISCEHLATAVKDIDLCNWSLMHIKNLLEEDDPERKSEARKLFFVFRGTSHLFGETNTTCQAAEFSASKNKTLPPAVS